jgi:hypothetical protein
MSVYTAGARIFKNEMNINAPTMMPNNMINWNNILGIL